MLYDNSHIDFDFSSIIQIACSFLEGNNKGVQLVVITGSVLNTCVQNFFHSFERKFFNMIKVEHVFVLQKTLLILKYE